MSNFRGALQITSRFDIEQLQRYYLLGTALGNMKMNSYLWPVIFKMTNIFAKVFSYHL